MKNSLKITLAFLAVAAIGGFAGILLAPEKGEKTRDKISKKGKKAFKKAKENLGDFYEKTEDIKDRIIKESEKFFS